MMWSLEIFGWEKIATIYMHMVNAQSKAIEPIQICLHM